jgi:hypothetical protein
MPKRGPAPIDVIAPPTCQVCGGANDGPYRRCSACRAKVVEYLKRRRELRLHRGLCSTCDAPFEPGHAMCRPCLDRLDARHRAFMERRRTKGCCPHCGAPWLGGAPWGRCSDCLAKLAEKRRKRCGLCEGESHSMQEHREAFGRCEECDRPRDCDSRFCPSHAAHHLYNTRELSRENDRRASRDALKKGLCSRCRKNPLAARSTSRCEECLAYAAAQWRARHPSRSAR